LVPRRARREAKAARATPSGALDAAMLPGRGRLVPLHGAELPLMAARILGDLDAAERAARIP
jgi:hypothetical protein